MAPVADSAIFLVRNCILLAVSTILTFPPLRCDAYLSVCSILRPWCGCERGWRLQSHILRNAFPAMLNPISSRRTRTGYFSCVAHRVGDHQPICSSVDLALLGDFCRAEARLDLAHPNFMRRLRALTVKVSRVAGPG